MLREMGRKGRVSIDAWFPETDHVDGILLIWKQSDWSEAASSALAQTAVNLYCAKLIARGHRCVPDHDPRPGGPQ